jgi:hypothetical protein
MPMSVVGSRKAEKCASAVPAVVRYMPAASAPRPSWYRRQLTAAKRPTPSSMSAKAASAERGRRRPETTPPSWLPRPSPAMNADTIKVTDTTPIPVWSVRMRCQTTW